MVSRGATQSRMAARDLSLTRGTGALDSDALVITAVDDTGLAVVTVDHRLPLAPITRSSRGPRSTFPSSADVRLLWRTDYAPGKVNSAPVTSQPGRLRRRHRPRIRTGSAASPGVALAIRGPLPQPVRIRGVAAKPGGAVEIMRDRVGEWFTFERWSGTSINTRHRRRGRAGASAAALLVVALVARRRCLVRARAARRGACGAPRSRSRCCSSPRGCCSTCSGSWNLARQVARNARAIRRQGLARAPSGGRGRSAVRVHREGAREAAGDAGARVHGRRRALLPRPRRVPPLSAQRLFDPFAQHAAAALARCARATTSSSTTAAASNTTPSEQRLRFEGGEPVSAEVVLVEPGAALFRIMLEMDALDARSPARCCHGCSGIAVAARAAPGRDRARGAGRSRVDRRRRLSRRRVRADAVDARAVARRHPVRRRRRSRCRWSPSRVALRPSSLAARRPTRSPRARGALRALVAPPELAARRARRLAAAARVARVALRAARRSRSRRGRSIRGTRGRSGRPRRASGTSSATSRRSRAPRPGSPPNGAVYFDASPEYPPTMPLLQVWSCIALGRWDDALMNWPWWQIGGRARARRVRRPALARSRARWRRSSAPSSWRRCRSPTCTSRSPATPTSRSPRATPRRRSRCCAGREGATRATPRVALLLAHRVHADQESGLVLGSDARPGLRRRAAAAPRRARVADRLRGRCLRARRAGALEAERVQLPAQPRFRSAVGRPRARATSCSATGICSGTARSSSRCSPGGSCSRARSRR